MIFPMLFYIWNEYRNLNKIKLTQKRKERVSARYNIVLWSNSLQTFSLVSRFVTEIARCVTEGNFNK